MHLRVIPIVGVYQLSRFCRWAPLAFLVLEILLHSNNCPFNRRDRALSSSSNVIKPTLADSSFIAVIPALLEIRESFFLGSHRNSLVL